MSADRQYDIAIIGTGAGGGTLAARLAPSGLRILLIERGDFVPREKENWDARAVFIENRYHTPDAWLDKPPTRKDGAGGPCHSIRTNSRSIRTIEAILPGRWAGLHRRCRLMESSRSR